MKPLWNWVALFAVIVASAGRASRGDILVFDSYTPPPEFGGVSSPSTGVATQLSATEQLTISRIAVRNEMLSAGQIKFVILSYPQPQFLFISTPQSFPQDITGETTWKESDPLSLTFDAESKYLVGYVHSVAVNEYVDPIAESGAGITSDLVAHTLFGFSSPTYGSAAFPLVDAPVRLYAVPEPSLIAPLLVCSSGLLLRRCRRRH